MSITAKMNDTGEIVTGIAAIRALSKQLATRVEQPNETTRAVLDPSLKRAVGRNV